MKPAVIAGGSENPPSNPGLKNNTTNDTNINNPNAYVNARQFPNIQPGFGFNEPDVDDIFSNVGLRSRLNRMRDPFAFGARKRCGNDPAADPYSRYFNDDDDFFPSFGQTWDTTRPRRRVVPDQQQQPQQSQQNHDEEADIFGRIPSEFRHYIPDGFGFGQRQRHPPQKTGGTPPSPQQQYSQQSNYYPQQQQQQQPQPQYYEQYPQPGSPTIINGQPKPKLCDAAIQTEDLGPIPLHDKTQTLRQHGLRNTVDLGIKSPQEECRSPRAQSAPPNDGYQTFANANAAAASSYPDSQNSQAQASASNDMNGNQYQQTGPQAFSQGTQMTPPTPPPRQNIPQFHANPQQQSHQSYSQPRYEQNPSQPEEGGFVRTVPIFVEGRSTPVINKDKRPPPPSTQQQHQEQRPQGQQNRPTPLNTQNLTPTPNQAPPQTPHTAECINKIQDIQRDVLDLMSKVENFKGLKNDKDYMYLDEMLTRNLLKLDTIDTNGKDSIRLARREAIKCIQASINVLEAKSEENLKTAKRESVMEIENNNLEEMKPDETNDNIINKKDEIEDLKPPPVIVALPPPPDHNPSQEIQDESKTNDEIKTDNKISTNPVVNPEESQLKPILEEEPAADVEKSSTEAVDSSKTEKDDVPEIEARSKESPKKKIIRKVKKGEKKTKTSADTSSPADTGTGTDGVQKETSNEAEETPKP